MPKPANQLETVPLRLSTTSAVLGYLKQLVSTGLYGRNHTEAAERLIARGIERLLQEGTIQGGPGESPKDRGGRKPRGEE
jgi:hypothetical protein